MIRSVSIAALLTLAACPSLSNPESEIADVLTRIAREPRPDAFRYEGLGTLTPERVRFDRLTAVPVAGAYEAVVTIDLDGTLRLDTFPDLPPIRVSTLGVERIPFTREQARWHPVTTPAPALGEALTFLLRNSCLRTSPRPSDCTPPTRWLLRTERARIEVLEENPSGNRRHTLLREPTGLRFAPDASSTSP